MKYQHNNKILKTNMILFKITCLRLITAGASVFILLKSRIGLNKESKPRFMRENKFKDFSSRGA